MPSSYAGPTACRRPAEAPPPPPKRGAHDHPNDKLTHHVTGIPGRAGRPDAEKAMRRTTLVLVLAAFAGVFAQSALAGGGRYSYDGGTPAERATVHNALEASSFGWGLIPQTVAVHIGSFGGSYATHGNVYPDATLLDAGRFSWGVVQHEFAHQVDFFLLDDAKRTILQPLLGGKDWCYSDSGLQHSHHSCERFASELAWAYWPSPENSMRPSSSNDEGGSMPVAQFRSLLAQLIGAPSTAERASTTKAYAPPTTAKKKRR